MKNLGYCATPLSLRKHDLSCCLVSRFGSQQLEENGTIELEELNADLANVIEVAKTKLREHFRRRATEAAANVVEERKKTKVGPYETEPIGILEKTERQVFDVVALNLNSYSPEFERLDVETKKLVLKLLRTVLGTNPPELQRISTSVIELPEDKQKDLAELLSKTTLQAIINAAKVVTNRLDFLRGLEHLVFDLELKERLLERKQLHRILVAELWIFGEQYHLALDDESLTTLLKKHNELLKRDIEVYEPVLREDNREGIIDLMLSKLVPLPHGDEREHLVVELKRPTLSTRHSLPSGDETMPPGSTMSSRIIHPSRTAPRPAASRRTSRPIA